MKLRIRRPAPTSSMQASATSTTMSASRRRRRPRSTVTERDEARIEPARSTRPAWNAGAVPKMSAVATDTASTKSITRQSIVMSASRGR